MCGICCLGVCANWTWTRTHWHDLASASVAIAGKHAGAVVLLHGVSSRGHFWQASFQSSSGGQCPYEADASCFSTAYPCESCCLEGKSSIGGVQSLLVVGRPLARVNAGGVALSLPCASLCSAPVLYSVLQPSYIMIMPLCVYLQAHAGMPNTRPGVAAKIFRHRRRRLISSLLRVLRSSSP